MFARHVYRMRRLRDSFLSAEIFGEASWDILLDLFASEAEGKLVRVTSACIAAAVPATTALRHLKELERRGIVKRVPSETDKRGQYVRLTETARVDMIALLERLRSDRLGAAPGRL
jgi:DNA-binding MarR family transcriptional regulator